MALNLYFPPEFPDPNWKNISYELEPTIVDGKEITQEFLLGRDPTCQLTINNRIVSRKHLSISYSANSKFWSIQDLGSENGTYLNGKKLKPYQLKSLEIEDRVYIASSYFKVSTNDTSTISEIGESTVGNTKPLDHRTGKPLPNRSKDVDIIAEIEAADKPSKTSVSRSKDDTVYLFVEWLIKPDTASGWIYRLLIICISAYVAIRIFGR